MAGRKKMDVVKETNQVPIVGKYDVIVVGGGIAGVGAALAARRNGCKVLLIEKSVVLGGLATLGFIAYYLPLCDGRGKKVSGGIAEELLHLSIKYGYSTLAPEWEDGTGIGTKKRYTSMFSPPEFIYALDELMIAEGVDLLFDTVFCRPVMKGNACQSVIVENKSGRTAYQAKMFVDASGDADLIYRAGAKCVEEKNYLAYWFYNTNLKKMKKAVESGNVMKGISLEWRGSFLKDGSYTLGTRDYKGTDAKHITRFILNGRKLLKKEIERNRKDKGSLIALPGMAQYRRTRRVKGMYLLKERDAFKSFDDSIGVTGHWLKPGIVYEIPYRTMINRDYSNILTVGRAVSASGDAWEALRVIPPAVLTGQAAGTAAVMAIKKKCAVADLTIADLQKNLEKAGVIIHYQP
ncbi:MAG: hypothetical protein AMK69_18260 [Nitrospira bacterium SG8_3]|nr:MAG: hypothetical protein AMK69_18260 [Nitrospira bacterium SG8_3]